MSMLGNGLNVEIRDIEHGHYTCQVDVINSATSVVFDDGSYRVEARGGLFSVLRALFAVIHLNNGFAADEGRWKREVEGILMDILQTEDMAHMERLGGELSKRIRESDSASIENVRERFEDVR